VEQLYGLVRDVVRRVRRPRSDHHTPETTDLVHRVWERTLLAGTSPGGADADAEADAAPDATDPSSDAAPARPPDPPRWQSREHFFNVVATATVQTLISEHRHRTAERRGGDAVVQSLDALPPTRHPALADARSPADLDPDVLADLLEALERFRLIEPRGATIVTLRFLAGLTIDEVAIATNCSASTVSREWRAARAWLFDQLAEQWPELARRGGAP
jgi:DNA-directed RNA polymerase specialized sigma24 family protein